LKTKHEIELEGQLEWAVVEAKAWTCFGSRRD